MFFLGNPPQRRGPPPRSGCQTACKPGSVLRIGAGMAIHLGRPLPDASRDRPGRRPGNLPAGPFRCRSGPACRPYLVLLPVGFAVPFPSPGTRCALTAPFPPSPPTPRLRRAVCFLWHFPWGRPRRALPGTVFPWSPDFPPPAGARPAEGDHPAVWQLRCRDHRSEASSRARGCLAAQSTP